MQLKTHYYNLKRFLKQPLSLRVLLIINLFGSFYGFYWYRQQLKITPGVLKLFVPDSPTASALFTIALFFIIIKSTSLFNAYGLCLAHKIWSLGFYIKHPLPFDRGKLQLYKFSSFYISSWNGNRRFSLPNRYSTKERQYNVLVNTHVSK